MTEEMEQFAWIMFAHAAMPIEKESNRTAEVADSVLRMFKKRFPTPDPLAPPLPGAGVSLLPPDTKPKSK